ncbi:ABC transporter ATP-binding protein, partial [Nitrososphaera sp. AFS]|uniref:ABC transporter ATP-binding protein n=1 Tax=Nitrososphaera sp. AFS TaxID=2301191 RepID=UPI0013923891
TLGSSFLRAVQPPGEITDGEITIDGTEIVGMSNAEFNKKFRWKKIAMIFQGAMNALDPVYKVGDQMREILLQHQSKPMRDDLITESLNQVGLENDVAKMYPHELSGGMKQRVIIAMALLLKPDIVIADEPTTALDVLVQAQIVNLLKRLKSELGMTIILITHDLGIISEIADKIAIMYAGQFVEFGPSSEIYENPKHPYTKALIAAIPRLSDNKKPIEFIKGNPPDLSKTQVGCRYFGRCPQAMDICKTDPPEVTVGGGFTKCWLYAKH